ncbi:MAG: YceI family protein [Deltaproteobacteria bacterium]|nr:YceI family protein [Deltaproteobacteria bacterium]
MMFAVIPACQSGREPLPVLVPQQIDVAQALQRGIFKLVIDASMIKVRTIKDSSIPVAASFYFNSGALNLNPGRSFFKTEIDITSFYSGLSVRDDNVLKVFFKTDETPNKAAFFSVAGLGKEKTAGLKTAKKLDELSVDGVLTYNQKEVMVKAILKISFNKYGRLVVETVKPFAVSISDLGLTKNLNELLVVCNHQSVDDVVQVEVHIEFEPG